MVDLLRIYGPSLLRLVIALIVLFVAVTVVCRFSWRLFLFGEGDNDELHEMKVKALVKRVAWTIAGLAWVGYALFLLSSLSVNATPRGVIDRSQVLDQQKAYEQRILNSTNSNKGEAK
jgi:hypothetical protein